MTTPDIAGLCERLRERRSHMTEVSAGMLFNTDGPEAADALERQASEIERLHGVLADLVSWFDDGPSSHGPWIITSGAYGADDAVASARAALTGEDT
jgi:hypothetical protein